MYRAPLDDLDDCDGSKYSLQLNVYKYILENFYGQSVSHMGLVSFHPNQEDYFYHVVPVRRQMHDQNRCLG